MRHGGREEDAPLALARGGAHCPGGARRRGANTARERKDHDRFPAERGFYVYALLHPQKRVAVFGAQSSPAGVGGGEWLSTSYAIKAPRQAFANGFDVDFGSLGRIRGRFVADGPPRIGHRNEFCRGRRPVNEDGHFEGAIVFRGDGGFLTARTRRVDYVSVSRTFRLRCRRGHAADFDNLRPGLFGYVEAPTDSVMNTDGTFLRSTARGEGRVTELMAFQHLLEDATSGVKAAAREWLPGEVAATRTVAIEEAPAEAFVLAGPERRPLTATIRPPAPFRGEARYDRRLGSLSGDLAVSFLGKELPLIGPGAELEVCAHPRLNGSWDCE